MKKRVKKGTICCHPVSMFEAVMALCILFLLFFGLLQIAEWSINTVFCQYSAFYASKGMALGYKERISLRAARVASIGIAGPAISQGGNNRDSDYERAQNYMLHGDASGVWYQYWGNIYNRKGPQIKLNKSVQNYPDLEDPAIRGHVFISNAVLLHDGLNFLLGIRKNPEPKAVVTSVNNAIYLED